MVGDANMDHQMLQIKVVQIYVKKARIGTLGVLPTRSESLAYFARSYNAISKKSNPRRRWNGALGLSPTRSANPDLLSLSDAEILGTYKCNFKKKKRSYEVYESSHIVHFWIFYP